DAWAVATAPPPQSAIPRVARIRPEAASGSPTTPITFVLPWHTCAPTPGALRLPGLRHMRNVARIRSKAASRPCVTEVRRRLGRRHGPATSKRDSIPRVARIRPKAASGADATCPPAPPTPSLPRAQRRQLHALGAPIHRNKTGTHIPMEGRVRPIHHTRHHAVLHRIDVHIRHVRSQVTLVADGVLPEPRLPRRLPVVRHASG